MVPEFPFTRNSVGLLHGRPEVLGMPQQSVPMNLAVDGAPADVQAGRGRADIPLTRPRAYAAGRRAPRRSAHSPRPHRRAARCRCAGALLHGAAREPLSLKSSSVSRSAGAPVPAWCAARCAAAATLPGQEWRTSRSSSPGSISTARGPGLAAQQLVDQTRRGRCAAAAAAGAR